MNGSLNNQEGNKEILALNENKTASQNLWGTMKAVIEGKFRAVSVYIKNKKDLK